MLSSGLAISNAGPSLPLQQTQSCTLAHFIAESREFAISKTVICWSHQHSAPVQQEHRNSRCPHQPLVPPSSSDPPSPSWHLAEVGTPVAVPQHCYMQEAAVGSLPFHSYSAVDGGRRQGIDCSSAGGRDCSMSVGSSSGGRVTDQDLYAVAIARGSNRRRRIAGWRRRGWLRWRSGLPCPSVGDI